MESAALDIDMQEDLLAIETMQPKEDLKIAQAKNRLKR